MGTVTIRNWGYLLLTSILMAAFMLAQSYTVFEMAQRECWDCFGGQYDFLKNEILPTFLYWLGGLLAATVFHQFVTPAIVRQDLGQKFGILSFFATFLGLGLVLAAALGYGYFNIDLYRNEMEDGPSVFPYFRTLNVFLDSSKLLIAILLYEAIVEVYVYLVENAKTRRSTVLKALSEFLLATVVLTLIWYVAKITYDAIFSTFDCRDCNPILVFWLFIPPVLLVHLHWFYRVIDILKRGFGAENRKNLWEAGIAPFVALVYFLLFDAGGPLSFGILVIGLITPCILGIGSAYLRYILVGEKRTFLTEITQTSAELGALRAQINPHFLFNALNTLYAIAMKENSEKTADGIQKLGDMMRFMLQENHQNRIPLAKEIEYLHNLIEIQQLRLDDNQQIDLKINLQNPDREVFIAPMLLNPLVENAFKHGISFRNPSWIYITLTHDPEHIFFKVHNSYHPKNELDPEKDSHGIGLDNVRKRLDLLYPDKHEFSIQVSEHDYFVSLILTIV